MTVKVATGSLYEGQDLWLLARVVAPNKTVLNTTTATNSACTGAVYEVDSAGPVAGKVDISGAITTQNIIQASLVLDGYWDEDDIGYNLFFRQTWASVSALLEGGRAYQTEIEVATGSFGIIPVIWRYQVLPRLGG